MFAAWPKPYQVQFLRSTNNDRPGVSFYELRPVISDFTKVKSPERMQGSESPRKEGNETVFRATEVLKIKQ